MTVIKQIEKNIKILTLSQQNLRFRLKNQVGTLFFLFFIATNTSLAQKEFPHLERSKNCLNYVGNPIHAASRKALVFSDKGAWFAYGFLDNHTRGGFSGPFLMTEQNGIWLSSSLTALCLQDSLNNNFIDRTVSLIYQNSYNSHLEQVYQNKKLNVKQQLVFLSGNTALERTIITNRTSKTLSLFPYYHAKLLLNDIRLSTEGQMLKITSTKSIAVGYVQFLNNTTSLKITKDGYQARLKKITIKPGQSKELLVSQSFIFPQYSWKAENKLIKNADFDLVLKKIQEKKEEQLTRLINCKKAIYKDSIYSKLIAKLILTLQNNSRIAAQGLKHAGLFPSYHYKGFHGFWAWDSWKHAVAVVNYDPELAKDQIRAMFDYQKSNGFVPDCIYRDTMAEPNNYRNTKPPLAAWAVWEIYRKTGDTNFLRELYPKLKSYHLWWYKKRDHDHDGLCEYGSTDGTLVAAKWESGMDNAVRFDSGKMLKNGKNAYSFDQESVDLNAYLFAEKNYLNKISNVLKLTNEAAKWQEEAAILKKKIRKQFWDAARGWFFDSNLTGMGLLSKDMGCEGYIPLWAGIATKKQAKAMMKNMMSPGIFNTCVPLPTLASNNPKFEPDHGYWRGPVWIDQSYFAIAGLEKYGFTKEANQLATKLICHAKGVLQPGEPIRENYQPITGKGLGARNFSWSAAHYLLLLLKN